MNKFILNLFFALLLISGQFVSASEFLHCTSYLPKGTAKLTIERVRGVPQQIQFEFQNNQLNEVYGGTLIVSGYNVQTSYAVAYGILSTPTLPIEVTLQGKLDLSELLSIGARADHRIEYGYGNYLTCSLQ